MDSILYLLSARRWACLTGLFCLIMVYLVLTEIMPRARASLGTYRQWQIQQERIGAARNWEQEITTLTGERSRLQHQFATLFFDLPRSDQMSVVLSALQKRAGEAGVSIVHLKPMEKVESEPYDALPLEIELKGRFHGLARFTDGIEQSEYLMKVERLRLASESLGSADLKARLLLSVIILKEQG